MVGPYSKTAGNSGNRPGEPTRKPRLLDRVRQAIRARHYSPQTEKAYVGWIKRFIFFNEPRHPKEMGHSVEGRGLLSREDSVYR